MSESKIGGMPYIRCKICGVAHFPDSDYNKHICKPRWEVRLDETGYTDEEYSPYFASDSEHAAEAFAESYDRDEHHLLRGEEIAVLVRRDANAPVERFTVTAEALPHYYAERDEYDPEPSP